jgi:DNA-binding CsgD family transcriptional regulator
VGSADIRLNPVTVAFLVEALIEHDDLDLAARELEESGLGGELPLAWATTPVLLARGRRRAAAGDHQRAVVDLLAVRDRCLRWGVDNPAMVPWRWNAALSLAHTGDRDHALVLVDEAIAVAERWGAPRSVGCALRAAGVVRGGRDGIELLEAAVGTLESSPAVAEHARAITDLGAALRRVGHRTDARRHLSAGLDLAHRLGAHAIARRAREELIIAGARPRRAALRGRDALTPSELRVAQLAAEGRTNKEIAEALFLTLRTVETHLTNSYSKLFITSRRQLREALGPDDR